jgi:hypothetical protein
VGEFIYPLPHELKQTYRAEFLGKWENLLPLRLLNDEHPGAEHTFRSIYIAKTIQKL